MAKKSKIDKPKLYQDKVKQDKISEFIDENYLEWIRNLECCVENCTFKSSPHHINSRKTGRRDDLVINLCAIHHNLGGIKEAIHQMGKKSWQIAYNIDLFEQAEKLRNQYLREINGK